MARRRGLVAPTSARRCEFQRSWLQNGLHNLPHSNMHVDVFEMMLGCSRLVGQLTSTLSAWPVPLISDGTSSRVAGAAGRVGGMHVSLGRKPWCHGGPSRADRGVGAFARRARCVGGGVWVGCRRAWPSRVTGRRVALPGGPYWFLAPNGSLAQDDKYNGAMADELTRQATWAGMPPVAQRALRATRAAPRTCLFW